MRALAGLQRREPFFDFGAEVLQGRGETQAFAQVLHVFVHGKSGSVGGHFEKNSARGAEINRAEIVSVHHGGGREVEVAGDVVESLLVLCVAGAERDVMNPAIAGAGPGSSWG